MDGLQRADFGICPVCSAPVATPIANGMWDGYDKAKRCAISGLAYQTTCAKCAEKLYSLPTKEDAEAGRIWWAREDETG